MPNFIYERKCQNLDNPNDINVNTAMEKICAIFKYFRGKKTGEAKELVSAKE